MNNDLEKKILEVADLIYNTGYVAGSVESRPMRYEDGYKYGLNTAWKVAKLEDVFKCKPSDIYNMSASEALEKIKEFQKKDTCNKCVHNKCNTCVHKNEDNICCGCVDDSEYEKEPEQTEKRCKTCDYYESLTNEWFKCNAKGDCKDHEQWTPKQTEMPIKLLEEESKDNTGKWVQVPAKFVDGEKVSNAYYKCSNCESIPLCGVRTNYCAKCSRKMR